MTVTIKSDTATRCKALSNKSGTGTLLIAGLPRKPDFYLPKYLMKTYRKTGIGKQLLDKAILWLKSNNTETQKLLVGVGNEQVFDFYKQFDFYPLHIVLQRIEKK